MSENKGELLGTGSVGHPRKLRLVLAAVGLIGVAGLTFGGEPVLRLAAGLAAGFSIVMLTRHQRRKAGQSSREAEVMAERLVEENRDRQRRLKESERRYEELEHYFETLLDHVPANIYFKDLESKFLKVNKSMARSFGCNHPLDVAGKTDHDFFESRHADQARADEKKIIRTGRGISGVVEHEKFSRGGEGWVLTTKMPFRDRSGEIIGTFGISSDVTELVTTRDTLERERNMLRALIDSFPDKICIRDKDRSYLLANKAMAEWVGAPSPEAMLGHRPEDYFPPQVTENGAREDRELLESGEPLFNRAWKLRDHQGETRHLLTTKIPLMDPDGRSWGVVGMDRDVTEQVRAKETLQETEQRLQEMMDNSSAVVYLKDLEGRYLMINRAYEELFGMTRKDVLGRTDHDFIADKSAAERFRENDRLIIERGEPMRMDEELYVEGEQRWFVSARFPLRDVRGKVRAVGAISTDITERKVAEEAMQRLNADLLQANEDLQRAQEQLIHAEKMESVGRLASGVAHEVKNPLAMIGMGLELLARRIPEDDVQGRETIERMKRGIERAKKIVKGLVDFSSARQLDLQAEEPNAVVNEALALVEYELKKAKVTVVRELGEGLPQVMLDATKIEQVLVNLMINAMHAMPEGGTLTLRTYRTVIEEVARDEGVRSAEHLRAGDCVVRIEIDDTGTGIGEENAGKLYDPFFTTKPTGVGTGLGLSVSRKIVELHHGTLSLANRPQGGVRARVTFKCK